MTRSPHFWERIALLWKRKLIKCRTPLEAEKGFLRRLNNGGYEKKGGGGTTFYGGDKREK